MAETKALTPTELWVIKLADFEVLLRFKVKT